MTVKITEEDLAKIRWAMVKASEDMLLLNQPLIMQEPGGGLGPYTHKPGGGLGPYTHKPGGGLGPYTHKPSMRGPQMEPKFGLQACEDGGAVVYEYPNGGFVQGGLVRLVYAGSLDDCLTYMKQRLLVAPEAKPVAVNVALAR